MTIQRKREATSVDLGIDDLRVFIGDHIAYLWDNEEAFAKAVGFIEVGLRGDDFCVIFGYEEANERVKMALQQHDFDCARLISEQRLCLLGGQPSSDQLLANIGQTFSAALERGAGGIRLLGNIGWGRPEWPDDKEILAFEAKVTGAARQFPSVVVCMYDLRRLSGPLVFHGAFETHPVTVYKNLVRENPYYVTVDEFLQRID